jgi:hypothetical protein
MSAEQWGAETRRRIDNRDLSDSDYSAMDRELHLPPHDLESVSTHFNGFLPFRKALKQSRYIIYSRRSPTLNTSFQLSKSVVESEFGGILCRLSGTKCH